MEIFVNTNYDFIKWRFLGVAFSGLVILAGLIAWFPMGLNIGIDFSGGANVVLRFQEAPPISQLRELAPDATIQQYGKAADNSVLIRLPQIAQETDYAGQAVRRFNDAINAGNAGKLDINYQGASAIADVLVAADPDNKGTGTAAREHYLTVARSVISTRSGVGIFHNFDEVKATEGLSPAAADVLVKSTVLGKFNLLNQETVGPQVGQDLQKKAALAVILSVLAMGLYIALRFDVKFGIAAIICLAHDVLVSLAFLILIKGEFSLVTVAAFLMIVGYSVNDTVVVYDRVRENAKKARAKESFADLMNRSMNQTLSRTVLTGGCVMIILVCLIFLGGEVINDFAWLLLVGSICGTYSTVTVVPAIVLAWNKYIAKKSGLYGGGTAE
ncbi:MAG: protein translocase subunit SecF [Thermoanaerobaculia bacterium]|nr:protein translocase subunit SecF [Thermoanaerobaculia bacterium]